MTIDTSMPSRKIVTPPAIEPLTLDEAKTHLKLDTSPITAHPDDTLIEGLIIAARVYCEQIFQNRAYITQTWDLKLDKFPAEKEIRIPLPPLQSLVWLKYKDSSGTLQTVSFLDGSPEVPIFETTDYIVDIDSEPGRLALKNGKSWPTTIMEAQAVQIRFLAGYGDAADVPDLIKAAIKLKLADLYENRGDANKSSIEGALQALLADRIWPV